MCVKIIEILLLATLIALPARYWGKNNYFWFGFGISLAFLSEIMLVAYLCAEHRADVYAAKIEQL
jgi:hypothetical protein